MDRRRFVLIATAIVLLGVALQTPSMWSGFFGDDYIQQAVLDRLTPASAPLRAWNLYDFGIAANWRASGKAWAPIWWTSPDWQVRFVRPLTSASIWLDHSVYGRAAWGYHLTSLAWYAVVLILALALLRALGLERRTALIAVALYACTNGAEMPVGWISNRNTVLATAATMAAVLCVVRLRSRWRIPTALALCVVALGCKESGVTAFVLVALWLLLEGRSAGDGGRGRRALTAAGISLAMAATYLAVLAVAGFGTRSWFYATPWREPLRYLANLAVLGSAGLLRLLAPVSIDLRLLLPGTAVWLALAGALIAWPVGLFVWRHTRAHPAAPFLAGWLLVSLAVEGSAPPSDRLLMQAAFGSAALIALFIRGMLAGDAGHARARRLERATAWTLVLVTGVLSGLNALGQSLTLTTISRQLRARVLATSVGGTTGRRVDAVVLQATDPMLPFVLTSTWLGETGRRDVRFSILQMGRRGLEWTREDDRTCKIRTTGDPFLTNVFESVYRSGPRMPAVGQVFTTPLFTLEVNEAEATGPRTLRLHFNRSLDAPDLRFLAPDKSGRLVPVTAPPVGVTTRLPEPVRVSPLLP
ncbi:MAG: hypothetical protein LJE95_14660 [Acidobacteria bacterium]|nr:hypothetical protein [Acidobacteriota bacterium]